MRMLQAVLGHQRRCHHPIRNQILPEVEDPLRHLRRPLIALRILIARPHQLGQGCCARPHFGRDDCVVDLFTPEGHLSAKDVLLLGVGEVEREVVVVDALPSFVRGAPAAAVAAVVKGGDGGIGVGHFVVARVVADPAAEAAVEVEEVGGGDDGVIAHRGEVFDVLEPVVPGLHDDAVGGDRVGVFGGEDDVFPHHEGAVRDGLKDGEGVVYPMLEEVVVAA